ncbi:MAG: S1 family peptidase [Rhodomicrobium sp.]
MDTAQRIHPLILTLALSLLVASQSTGALSQSCLQVPGTANRIVGNSDASAAEWPGIAALIEKDPFTKIEKFFCGGNAVAQDWVLTAAHCVNGMRKNAQGQFVDYDGSVLKIAIGVTDLAIAKDEDFYEPADIQIYPGYIDARHDGKDVALIRLSRPYSGSCASPGRFVDENGGKYLRVAGFGRDGQKPQPFYRGGGAIEVQAPSRFLRNVPIPSIPLNRCRTTWASIGCGTQPCYLTDAQLCAGSAFEHEDACQGDSGGPLVAWDPKSSCSVLVGLVSWGSTRCGELDHYGVYSNLSAYQEWIDRVTAHAIAFKDVPPVQLSQQQEDLLAALDKLLDPARGNIKIFAPLNDNTKVETPFKVQVASRLAGRMLIISLETSGNVIQLFPFVKEQVESTEIKPGITDLPPEDLHMHFYTSRHPGEAQLIAILVPPSFPLAATFDLAKYMAKPGEDLYSIVLNENEKVEYLMKIIEMIETTAKAGGPGSEANFSSFGYDKVTYQAK